jgi:acyl-coenzyme A synthetase/AMP-(fatty) acid ligase
LEYPLQAAEGLCGDAVKVRIHTFMGKIVVIDNIHVVSILPKTSSGKRMRGLIIAVLAGHSLENDLT